MNKFERNFKNPKRKFKKKRIKTRNNLTLRSKNYFNVDELIG